MIVIPSFAANKMSELWVINSIQNDFLHCFDWFLSNPLVCSTQPFICDIEKNILYIFVWPSLSQVI